MFRKTFLFSIMLLTAFSSSFAMYQKQNEEVPPAKSSVPLEKQADALLKQELKQKEVQGELESTSSSSSLSSAKRILIPFNISAVLGGGSVTELYKAGINVIPYPQEVKLGGGDFVLGAKLFARLVPRGKR